MLLKFVHLLWRVWKYKQPACVAKSKTHMAFPILSGEDPVGSERKQMS